MSIVYGCFYLLFEMIRHNKTLLTHVSINNLFVELQRQRSMEYTRSEVRSPAYGGRNKETRVARYGSSREDLDTERRLHVMGRERREEVRAAPVSSSRNDERRFRNEPRTDRVDQRQKRARLVTSRDASVRLGDELRRTNDRRVDSRRNVANEARRERVRMEDLVRRDR
jgi:hypothetical protein